MNGYLQAAASLDTLVRERFAALEGNEDERRVSYPMRCVSKDVEVLDMAC